MCQPKDLALWYSCFLRNSYQHSQCDSQSFNLCYVPTFIHKYCFRNLLTVTPTERDNNVKEWRSEARWGFFYDLGCVHKELCKVSDGAYVS